MVLAGVAVARKGSPLVTTIWPRLLMLEAADVEPWNLAPASVVQEAFMSRYESTLSGKYAETPQLGWSTI